MAKGKSSEPTVPITIEGVVYHVPQWAVKLEHLIADAAKKAQTLTRLATERDNLPKVRELKAMIEAEEAEIAKLRIRLAEAQSPYDSPINTTQAELEAIEAQIAEQMRPHMGGQKTKKYTGAAGTIEAMRKLGLKVIDKSRLRKLLGQQLGTYFTVEEIFTPNKAAAELPTTLKGNKLAQFLEAVEVTDAVKAKLQR